MMNVEDSIEEYLKHYDFMHTVECFNAEREQKSITASKNKVVKTILEEMLEAFDVGDEERFFFLWNRSVGQKDRHVENGRRVEFQVHLHMAVYGVRSGEEFEQNERFQSFKRFIDTRGEYFSSDPEYCQYFALPYTKVYQLSVGNHPVRQLLEEEWLVVLRKNVHAFLQVNIPMKKIPLLCSLIQQEAKEVPEKKTFDSGESYVKQLYATTSELMELIRDLRRAGGHRAESIASEELMNDLHERVKIFGQTIDDNYLYHETVGHEETIDDDHEEVSSEEKEAYLEQPQDISEYDQAHTSHDIAVDEIEEKKQSELELERPWGSPRSPKQHEKLENFNLETESPLLPKLNFQDLKSDISELLVIETEASMRQVCLLLQALRWRISRSSRWELQEKVLHTMIENDMLGIIADTNKESKRNEIPTLLDMMLNCSSELIQEYVLRYLTYIASHATGRNYLVFNYSFSSWIVETIGIREWEFDVVGEYALCLCQKLSMKPEFCAQLLNIENLLRNIFLVLESSQHYSPFVLEYSAALILNLALSDASKFTDDAEHILAVLEGTLLNVDLSYIHNFAVGTLYALFSNESIRELPDHVAVLNQLLFQSESNTVKKQLSFIIEGIRNGSLEERQGSSDVEDHDDMAPEEDGDENVLLQNAERRGESLLVSEYLLEPQESKLLSPNSKSQARLRAFRHLPDEMASKPKVAC